MNEVDYEAEFDLEDLRDNLIERFTDLEPEDLLWEVRDQVREAMHERLNQRLR